MRRAPPPPAPPAPEASAADARPLRVLVVYDTQVADPDLRVALRRGLEASGCEVVGVVAAGFELQAQVEVGRPDLIIIDAESDWRDAVEGVCVATQDAPRPIVLFTDNADTRDARRAIAAGVSAYVVAGLAPERVKPVLDVAVARFEVEQGLRAELVAAQSRLEERKRVERAKGVLMDKLGLSEAEAFARLRRLAMDRKIPIAEAAQRVLDTAALLG